METYTFLREMADSWALLALFLFFIGVFFWAFRPGSRPLHDDAADVVFRYEDAPLRDLPTAGGKVAGTSCDNACPGCTCGKDSTFGREVRS